MFDVSLTKADFAKAAGIVIETLVAVAGILAVYHFVLR